MGRNAIAALYSISDLLITSELLYQLSHTSKIGGAAHSHALYCATFSGICQLSFATKETPVRTESTKPVQNPQKAPLENGAEKRRKSMKNRTFLHGDRMGEDSPEFYIIHL